MHSATPARGVDALLIGSGLVTALPLDALRLRRTPHPAVDGRDCVQYIGPTLQFLIGVLVFHEAVPARARHRIRDDLGGARDLRGRRALAQTQDAEARLGLSLRVGMAGIPGPQANRLT